MSDAIKHECGVAMVRLLKPLEYYREKYGDALWGLNKLYLLMEKQHNRGQEGAGMATVKLDDGNGEIGCQTGRGVYFSGTGGRHRCYSGDFCNGAWGDKCFPESESGGVGGNNALCREYVYGAFALQYDGTLGRVLFASFSETE